MPPTRNGKAKTATKPAASAPAANAGQRAGAVRARSGWRTGRPVREASTQGPSPRENCSSSNSSAVPSVTATVPAGPSSVISASPTPLTGTVRAQSLTRPAGRSVPLGDSASTTERISVTRVDATSTSTTHVAAEGLPISVGLGLFAVLGRPTLIGQTLDKGAVA